MAPEGVIIGGWSYVIAAYVLVGVVLAAYAAHLIARTRSLDARRRRSDDRAETSVGDS